MQIAHGDVLLIPINHPAPLTGTSRTEVTLTAGVGETGIWHSHVLIGDLVLDEATRIVQVAAATLVTRDREGAVTRRHESIAVPAGTYRIALQREFSPQRDMPAAD